MSFIWPRMLWLLLLTPLLVWVYFYIQGRRRRYAARYGSLGLVQSAAGKGPGLRRHIPPALFLLGLVVLFLALARPQALLNLPRVEGTVILAFDVSGSMSALDIEPSRMEAAKAAARDFVAKQPSTLLVGVVAFSDSGFAIQAPTNEQETILKTIERLEPQRGTSLGHGILASINTIAIQAGHEPPFDTDFSPEEAGVPIDYPKDIFRSTSIILITDGENTTQPDPVVVARIAKELGVRVYTVGIGSEEGAVLDIEGFKIHTRLDEPALQQIAQITGGTYYNAQNQEDLQQIYNQIGAQLVVKPEDMEITSIFAGASILILMVGGALSLFWFGRLP